MNNHSQANTGHGPPGADLQLSLKDFKRVADIALKQAGLTIPENKLGMIQSRLSRRLRATGHRTFSDYLTFLESQDGVQELPHTISTLTTNVSHFFREDHHFQALEDSVYPDLIRRAKAGARIRLWSAGCSSGQEPYSMAMLLVSMAPDIASYDVKILATDIDRNILATARAAIYERRQIEGISDRFRKAYLKPSSEDPECFEITSNVRQLISFKQLNLMAEWPMRSGFDIIFCRNVVIYFSAETQMQLWPRFRNALAPNGLLFLGHSERISTTMETGFQPCGVTTYQRT